MESLPLALGVLVTFVAGLVSFLSPCVLPLVPSYLSFVTGMSLEDLQQGVDRRNTLVHAALFVVGFSVIFILLQATAFFLGQFLRYYEVWIARIGGVVLAVLGLHLMGAFRITPLLRERRVHLADKPTGYLGTVATGMAFGAGWTPCIGPVLGAVIGLAGTSEELGRGMTFLVAYCAGLGVPFMVSAVALERFLEAFQRFRRYMMPLQVAAGAVLVFLGVLLMTGLFTRLTSFLYTLTPDFLFDFEYWLLDRGI